MVLVIKENPLLIQLKSILDELKGISSQKNQIFLEQLKETQKRKGIDIKEKSFCSTPPKCVW